MILYQPDWARPPLRGIVGRPCSEGLGIKTGWLPSRQRIPWMSLQTPDQMEDQRTTDFGIARGLLQNPGLILRPPRPFRGPLACATPNSVRFDAEDRSIYMVMCTQCFRP